jgi:pimeloyl-ACP methyl ester carboxylesterase
MSHGRLSLLAALAVLAITVAACSKNNAPSSSQMSSQANTASTAAAVEPPRADGSIEIATEPEGIHIEYRRYGSGDVAVMLIHGWATDANYWNKQFDPLKAKYTVVAVDLAGHGGSTKNRKDWSMENYGVDVAAVARKLGNQKIVLVGHSMGGTVALEAAPRIGDRVIGIIVVDALKSVGLPPMPRAEIEKQIAPFRTDFIGSVRKYATDSLFQKDADPLFVQKVAYDMSLEPPEVGVASLESLLSFDFTSILPSIHVPVLAINSDLGATDEARIAKFLPTFKAEIIPNTGHFLMMEAPDKFTPILLRDIDTLVQGSDRPH